MPRPFVYRPVALADLADACRQEPVGSREIRGVVLHHTAEPDIALWRHYGNEKTVRAIYNGHIDRNFRDIGYHLIVLPDGVSAMCRPWWDAGAHASTWNPHTLGVSMIGNFSPGEEQPTQEQREAVAVILPALAGRFRFELDDDYHPGGQGLGFHRDEPQAIRNGKDCPGSQITKSMVRGWCSGAGSDPEAESDSPDRPDFAPWAEEAFEACEAAGILVGYPDGTRRGYQPVTRNELAVVMARLLRAQE